MNRINWSEAISWMFFALGILSLFCMVGASAQGVPDATGEAVVTQSVDWWDLTEKTCTVVLVPLLAWLATIYKDRRGVKLALKVVAAVIERIEPSELEAEEKPIKVKILNEAIKTGEPGTVDKAVNEAKGQ